VISLERLKISVAPHEVVEKEATAKELAAALGLSEGVVTRAVNADRPWVVFQGHYAPSVQSSLSGLRGVYAERIDRRTSPNGPLGSALLGHVVDGVGAGGIEEAFDFILRGTPGRQMGERDAQGRAIAGGSWLIEEPVPGGDVVLTIDLNLQEIAHEALLDAIESTGARGGDLIITDPRTGELLAAVSLSEDADPTLSAINAPYEPGSTIKPFIVAGLLHRHYAQLSDSIDTEDGTFTFAGRTVHDVSRKGMLSLAEVLRYSSNVGMAKAVLAYEGLELYETLRDFGFGQATGLPLPGEQAGRLRHPDQWSKQSQVSLAIGYEAAVTPLQMALAYGAVANGGTLMEARLVRELKDPSGRVTERFEPQKIRRVVSQATAQDLARAMVDVVEGGSGTRARLATFEIAGKSGTSRAYGPTGYAAGEYFSSFAGFFPADDPRLVLFVKLDRPQGRYYGGATAAPVTRQALEAILAASRGPLDPTLLEESRVATARNRQSAVRFASTEEAPIVAPSSAAAGGAAWAWSDIAVATPPEPVQPRPEGLSLPDLTGLPARGAVRRLHAYGFRVEWSGDGAVSRTEPAAGVWSRPGDVIRVISGSGK